MSINKVVAHLAFVVLMYIAGCSSQTPLPVVSPLPVASSTPLPPTLPTAALLYYNGFRPIFPQQYAGGPAVPPQFIGGPAVPPQFIGGPNVPQRFINGPIPYNGQFVPILQQSFDITPERSYTFSFQSADGTQRQESGGLKYPSVQGFPPVMSVQGSYSAITPEGIPIEVSYIADENGYQPSGPGIHPAIQRAVAQQVAQAKQEQSQPQLVK